SSLPVVAGGRLRHMEAMTMAKLLVPQFAKRVGRSDNTVRKWLRQGHAPGVGHFEGQPEDRRVGTYLRSVTTLAGGLFPQIKRAISRATDRAIVPVDEIPAGRIHERDALYRWPWLTLMMIGGWRRHCSMLGRAITHERYRCREKGRVSLHPFYVIAEFE